MQEFKNLDALADQLYQDGMEKAKTESDRLLEEANKKSAKIISNAKKEADQIIAKSKKEAEKHRTTVNSEIAQKAKQAKQDLKTEIEQLVSAPLLNQPIKELLTDKAFVEKLIISTLETWKEGKEVEVHIPELLADLESDLRAKVHRQLPDLKVTMSNHLDDGFVIESRDKGYILSFTASDFRALFEPYLTEAVRNILFNNHQ